MSKKINLGSIKQWFSIKEIEKINLKGLPKCRRRILSTLIESLSTGGKRRPLKAKGGGYEYHREFTC